MPVMVGKPCVKFLMNCIMNSDLLGEEEQPRGEGWSEEEWSEGEWSDVNKRRLIYPRYPAAVGLHNFLLEIYVTWHHKPRCDMIGRQNSVDECCSCKV